jgi:hypothetical protein
MVKKAVSSPDLMTTIARGVGSTVGRIENTAQRLATASSEVIERASKAVKKARASKPKPSARKKAGKKAATRKPKSKAREKTSRTKA